MLKLFFNKLDDRTQRNLLDRDDGDDPYAFVDKSAVLESRTSYKTNLNQSNYSTNRLSDQSNYDNQIDDDTTNNNNTLKSTRQSNNNKNNSQSQNNNQTNQNILQKTKLRKDRNSAERKSINNGDRGGGGNGNRSLSVDPENRRKDKDNDDPITPIRKSNSVTATNVSREYESIGLQLEDHVAITIKGSDITGLVRFIGDTQFASGVWVGIEIDSHLTGGKNDGSVKGVKYFVCNPERGLFVRPNQVRLVHSNGQNLNFWWFKRSKYSKIIRTYYFYEC